MSFNQFINKMNALETMRKFKEELKEEFKEEEAKSIYNSFLIKGILNTVRTLNHEKENSKEKYHIDKINKAKNIIMDYFDNVYNDEINSSKPQNYLDMLKELKKYSGLNILSLSSLEIMIDYIEKDYSIPVVLKHGFIIKRSENILKNLEYNIKTKNFGIKNQVLKNAYKAVQYLGIKVPDGLDEATIKLACEVLSEIDYK